MSIHRFFGRRPGNVIVLSAILAPVLAGMLAMAVDLTWLVAAKHELQTSTDNCSLAAANYLANSMEVGFPLNWVDMEPFLVQAETYGYGFMSNNRVAYIEPEPQLVRFGKAVWNGDRVVGFTPRESMNPNDPEEYKIDAVRVQITMNGSQQLSSLFGGIFGFDAYQPQTEAITLLNIHWRAYLPFAVRKTVWDCVASECSDAASCGAAGMSLSDCVDNWGWDEDEGEVLNSADGDAELNIYPVPSGVGAPGECSGNFGALDIDGGSNAAGDLAEWGWFGVPPDLIPIPSQVLGDTGISNSSQLRAALESRVGEVVGVYLYDFCEEQGSNTLFNIVEVGFGRMMEVRMNGNPKRVMVQPHDPPYTTVGWVDGVALGM